MVSGHYLEYLLADLHNFRIVGRSYHKKDTYWSSNEKVKGRARGGHFNDISSRKRSFPDIISSIYWPIYMIFA